jgi:hypothetical protein
MCDNNTNENIQNGSGLEPINSDNEDNTSGIATEQRGLRTAKEEEK